MFGLGLGNSIQKLFFLPEAHTDFLFSILAEELGLVGATLVRAVCATLILASQPLDLVAPIWKSTAVLAPAAMVSIVMAYIAVAYIVIA